jgi:hypothetical protein
MSEHGASRGTIRVTRNAEGYRDRFRKYKVLVDGAKVGVLKPGETVETAVPTGEHRVRIAIDWSGSPEVVVAVAADETVALECEPGSGEALHDLAGTKSWVELRRS